MDKPRSTAWQTALTVLQEAQPPFIPEGAHAMTVVIEYPPGDPGAPPHRHPGPAFGVVLEGENTVTMLCESGKPMFTLVEEAEPAQRKDRRAPRPS
ncbi:cupin domain-containing protein [Nonomuraea sp. NPDC050022]|uniref:cupin domain-containing protein n=1 Tax=unclassified Nonomuraea TaxID=2593643 RepID=UPI00340AA0F3